MSERWFKCGVCGTEARGFGSDLMLAGFADDHADACAGHAPSEALEALRDATAFKNGAALNRARVLLGQKPIPLSAAVPESSE